MKNLSLLCIATAMISLASCKKEYTCECTTNYDDDKIVTTRDISKTSKSTAEAICGNYSEADTYTNFSPANVTTDTYMTTCALK